MSEQPVSVSAFARMTGVSHTAVQKAIADKRLVRAVIREPGAPPKLLASIATAEWRDRSSPGHRRTTPSPDNHSPQRLGNGGGDDYRRSATVEKIVRAKLLQVRLEEEQGRLVDADEVRKEVFALTRMTRDQFLELPDRLADELALESNASRVRAILHRELTDVLRSLADRCNRHELLSANSAADR